MSYVPKKPLVDLLKEAIAAGDFPKAETSFRRWREDPVNAYAVPEAENPINRLGYELASGGRLDAALGVFRMNAAAYPQSANVHDSLGEAYAATGNREDAIRSYEKALALDPNLRSAAEALAKLRAR